jgi:uncharacterized protein with FMN-binding domain
MHRVTAAIFGAGALALSNANIVAAAGSTKAAPKTKVVTARKAFTGSAFDADRWGPLQVTIIVKKTTTTNLKTKKKTVKKRIVSVRVPVYPDHTDRSVYINQQALPYLIQETIQAQSARIDMVSGATNTSDAYDQSLQSAILKDRAW